MDIDALAQKLRNIRKDQGFTQETLAAVSGVDRRVIQRIEGGEGSPTLSTLSALSESLKVDITELIGAQLRPLPDYSSVAKTLEAMSQLDPDFQRIVLSLIHGDVEYMKQRPDLVALIPKIESILKFR